MKKVYFTIFIIFTFLCLGLNAQTIAVVNIQFLIDNNNFYKNISKEIENSRKKNLLNFELKENELKSLFNEIDNSKLILSDNEINIRIDQYNKKLDKFNFLIDEFNFHYQSELINIREVILNEIIILLEEYAIENNIDLILDSTSYLIASNSLDITININEILSNKKISLEYREFENNELFKN